MDKKHRLNADALRPT